MAGQARESFITVRVTPAERREAALLAKARGVSKSELLRRLVREAAEKEALARSAGVGRDTEAT